MDEGTMCFHVEDCEGFWLSGYTQQLSIFKKN